MHTPRAILLTHGTYLCHGYRSSEHQLNLLATLGNNLSQYKDYSYQISTHFNYSCNY